MFGRRLALLARAKVWGPRASVGSQRKLYTDSIYPYPFNYINNVVHPSQAVYRENWPENPWDKRDRVWGMWGFRVFWFYFFINLFNDPGVILGHHTFPDPSAWTDAELGIPTEDAGSYKEWEASKGTEKE